MTSIETTAEIPALIAYLDSLVAKLRDHLTGAVVKSDVIDIHQARVATRRLKAGLELFGPVLSEGHAGSFGKTLKKLRRRLGALRDHDVMIEMLGSLRRKRFAGAQVWMLQRLHERRRELAGDLTKAVNLTKALTKVEGQWAAVRSEMVEARDAVESLLRDSVGVQVDEFARRAGAILAEKTSTEACPAEEAKRAMEDSDPHELRIAGKALRYTLEMAVEAGRPMGKKTVSAFKKMQEALGEWHDGVVLAQTGMRLSLEEELALHDGEMQRDVLGLAGCMMEGAGKAFGRFGELWQAEGERIRSEIEVGIGLGGGVAIDGAGNGDVPSGA